MIKQYIDKEEWIGRLEEELSTCKNEKRKEYLIIWINAIKCQPTVSEKEIIRKTVERVLERLEEARAECKELQRTTTDAYGYMKMKQGIDCAKDIVKEEGGIDG